MKAERDALAGSVAQRRGTLAALDAEAAKLRALAASAAAQAGVPVAKLEEEGGLSGAAEPAGDLQRAALLPLPLYVLYTQLRAAAAAGALPVAVALGGDAAAAAAPNAHSQQVFPLWLEVAVWPAGGVAGPVPAALRASFRYMSSRHQVCVAGTVPGDDTALASLFPGDAGSEVAAELGRAYEWAQHAAGLDVLPLLPPGLGEGAAAALDRYGRERRGEALLGRMVAAAGARY